MKKVSVIIPVYNSEKHIGKCLDSVMNQTFEDYEVIIINDGSKDNSLYVINSYANQYSNIKVINQDNIGVAETRNKGIKLSKSKYIMFIDNDDWVEKDYIEKFYRKIEKTKANIVIGGYRRCTNQKTIFEKKIKTNLDFYSQLAPWAKIYKTSFLKNNNLCFFSHPIGEDVYFNVKAYNKTDKIYALDYIGYNWFYNNESVSNSKQKKGDKDLKVLNLLDKIYKNTTYNDELEYFYIRYCVWFLLFTIKNTKNNIYKDNHEKVFGWLDEHCPNYKKNKYLKKINNNDYKTLLIIKTLLYLKTLKIDKFTLNTCNKLFTRW